MLEIELEDCLLFFTDVHLFVDAMNGIGARGIVVYWWLDLQSLVEVCVVHISHMYLASTFW